MKKQHKQQLESQDVLFSGRDLRLLIVPLVIEQVLAITVGMADTMMISSAGEAAVSGVSLVDMVNVVLINIFAALATGGAVVTSQFLGARDTAMARRSATQLVSLCGLFSIFVMVLTLIFRRPLLHGLFGSIEADVMQNALIYIVISAVSYPFLAVYNACAALFRSMGNSRISMNVSLLMNVINIIGNSILIFIFHMGVAGAALATLVARMTAAVIMFKLAGGVEHEARVEYRGLLRLDFSMVKRILRIGVPNGLENSFFQLGRVLVVSIIALFGTTQIAANAVANNLDSLGCIPGQAMNLAMITVVGQCIGAGDFRQTVWYVKKMMKITYLMSAIVNALILVLLPLLLRIYNLSPETLALATVLVLIHDGMAILLWPMSFTLPNALRAANDVKYTMVIAIASMLVFRILFSYILGWGLQWGAVGVWVAMVMDWVFRAACFLFRFVRGRWKLRALPQ